MLTYSLTKQSPAVATTTCSAKLSKPFIKLAGNAMKAAVFTGDHLHCRMYKQDLKGFSRSSKRHAALHMAEVEQSL